MKKLIVAFTLFSFLSAQANAGVFGFVRKHPVMTAALVTAVVVKGKHDQKKKESKQEKDVQQKKR